MPPCHAMRRLLPRTSLPHHRTLTTTPVPNRALTSPTEISDFLSKPTWSVKLLLLSASGSQPAKEEVTPTQLHHLLRLSALPPSETRDQEQAMLKDLHSQLHFIRQIQAVDTTGVEPLRSLRPEPPRQNTTPDSTNPNTTQDPAQHPAQHPKENTSHQKLPGEIGVPEMQEALAAEEIVGNHHKRIRRRRGVVDEEAQRAEDWDVLGQAGKKVGRYFVVEGGGTRSEEG